MTNIHERAMEYAEHVPLRKDIAWQDMIRKFLASMYVTGFDDCRLEMQNQIERMKNCANCKRCSKSSIAVAYPTALNTIQYWCKNKGAVRHGHSVCSDLEMEDE